MRKPVDPREFSALSLSQAETLLLLTEDDMLSVRDISPCINSFSLLFLFRWTLRSTSTSRAPHTLTVRFVKMVNNFLSAFIYFCRCMSYWNVKWGAVIGETLLNEQTFFCLSFKKMLLSALASFSKKVEKKINKSVFLSIRWIFQGSVFPQ